MAEIPESNNYDNSQGVEFMGKKERRKKIVESVIQKIEKNIPDILESVLDEYDLEDTSTKIDNLEKLINNLKDELKNIKKEAKKDREKGDEMFTMLKNILECIKGSNDELQGKLEELTKNKHMLNQTISKQQQELDNLKSQTQEFKGEKDSLETKLKDVEEKCKKDLDSLNLKLKDLDSLENKCKQLEEEKSFLKEFQKTVANEKLLSLLNKILNNRALESFRKEFNILDKNAESIANLLKRVADEKVFVNSFYKSVEEYKKENQEALLDEEIAFYKEVNNYFSNEIFTSITKTVSEEKFDKSLHRSIDGQSKGELSEDKALLIPKCSVEDRKIKVKLK